MKLKQVYVVIDALDECLEQERPETIRLLTEVMTHLPCAKVFVTSRRESDIERAFVETSTPTIQIKAENVEADIRRYAKSEVKRLRQGHHGKKLFLSNDAIQERVIHALTEKAEGMFLWVNLQLDNLCRISELQQDDLVEAALVSLPQGLDATYLRIVQRIESQPNPVRDLALAALMWVLHAKRPLHWQELQHALATERAYETRAKICVGQIEITLGACGNLIAVEGDAVRPIHYSVQEYFTSGQQLPFQGYIQRQLSEPATVHKSLASVCIKYLLLSPQARPHRDVFDLYSHMRNVQFASYAIHHFDWHAARCAGNLSEILPLLDLLLGQNPLCLAAIIQMRMANDGYWIYPRWKTFRDIKYDISASTIIYATHLFECSQVSGRWLDSTIPLYALHQAAVIGSVSAIGHILKLGADVKEADPTGAQALYYAAQEGHAELCRVLFDHGLDVNAQGGDFGNALQAACLGGHIEVANVLLGKGANVNAQGGEYGNALQAACSGGHVEVAKLLLDKGADVNAQGGHFGNALQAACSRGHIEVVKLLLDKEADVNAQGGYYGNALHAACFGGHVEVVNVLLDNGADVNAQGGEYGNALQAACYGGYVEVVKLLLHNGANVNAQGGEYGNALQAACSGGHVEVAKLLLDKGADVDAQGGDYGNALQAACSGGHVEVVKLLLDNGADVNAQGGRYGSAMQAAKDYGNDDILNLLLRTGATLKD